MLFKEVQQIIISLSCKNLIYYIRHFSLALQQWGCSYRLLINEGAIYALAGATVQYTNILLLGECWCCSSNLLYCKATSSVIACKLRHMSDGCLLLIISLPRFIQIFSWCTKLNFALRSISHSIPDIFLFNYSPAHSQRVFRGYLDIGWVCCHEIVVL